ncbi:hypothetical protein L596_015316 [Steinernema carpocapsae]|uniref:Uncharacterized protein n=1 Tax=Steinernema carpocapsae TaxID=34508 RepID=A0A4U5NEM4_STECR|nr:hypothetical protein L596_015316 [Steinernema carpocapsae]
MAQILACDFFNPVEGANEIIALTRHRLYGFVKYFTQPFKSRQMSIILKFLQFSDRICYFIDFIANLYDLFFFVSFVGRLAPIYIIDEGIGSYDFTVPYSHFVQKSNFRRFSGFLKTQSSRIFSGTE